MHGFAELIEVHLAREAERVAAVRQAHLEQQITDLEARLEESRAGVEAAEAEVKRLQVERRAAELEVEKIEATRKKYREQLMSAKTNEVYKTLLHEIETTGQFISDRETVVLEVLEKTEDAVRAVDAAKVVFRAAEQEKQAREKSLRADHQSAGEERTAAAAKAETLARAVPIDMLERYRRIAEARGGRGMALATNSQCEACRVAVRPQAWVDMVTMKGEPYACPGCKRLLYREENVPRRTEAHANDGHA